MQELDITENDLIQKTDKLKILRDHKTRFREPETKRVVRVISDEERQRRSQRLKDYWAKNKLTKPQKNNKHVFKVERSQV